LIGTGPSGHPAAGTAPAGGSPAVVHVDLDGLEDIGGAHGWTFDRHDAEAFFSDAIERGLGFFDAHDIKATWFVIGEHLRNPSRLTLLRSLVQRGHTVGSHTMTHRPLTRLTSAEKQDEIARSREVISDSLGAAVDGFRAPGFYVDREVLEMVAEAGYQYDTSLHADPHVRRDSALHEGPEGRWRLTGEHEAIELFLPRRRPLPFPFHPSYSLILGTWYFRLGLYLAGRGPVPLVLLFHLTDFARTPIRSAATWQQRVFTLSAVSGDEKARRCAAMVRAVQRRYRFVRTGDVLHRELSSPGDGEDRP